MMMVMKPEVLMVTMMMAIVPMVIGAHPAVGVLHSRVRVAVFDDRRLRCSAIATGERRRCENGNRKQRCGNGLEHGCLLIQGIRVSSAGWPDFADHTDAG